MLSLFIALSSLSGPVRAAQGDDVVAETVSEIVESYREVISLFADESNLDDQQETKASIVGKVIYHQNLSRLESLQTLVGQNDLALDSLLKILENDDSLWDADKLAFKGFFEELLDGLQFRNNRNLKIESQVQGNINALSQIQERYNSEITDIFSRLGTRAIQPKREAWDDYIAFLKERFSLSTILDKYDTGPSLISSYRSKGKTKNKSQEIFGLNLPKKTLLLTFDDGPHKKFTPKILATLKKYNIKPVFFHVGKNLGSIDSKNKISLSEAAKISAQIIAEGMLLANHSYSHSLLPKLDKQDLAKQIDKTNRLLKEITGETTVFFRAPYGARNEAVLSQVKARKLKSMMWNIDSRDWADPVPKSIAKRVLTSVAKQKKGIILFHDIQSQTVEALPLILDSLIAQGYQFAAWNGKEFSVDGKSIGDLDAEVKKSSLYRDSWAVIIGIDKYRHWPKLNYAVNDALGVKEKLVTKYGFKRENIFTLLNEEATRDNILKLFHDKLTDPKLVQKSDRVFVFYAGHGATRKLASGRDLGYIIPVEANDRKYYGESISMTNIGDISEAIAAKHLLFVMDSCYSGLALLRGGGQVNSINYINDNSARSARQMFTAGGADQQVADSGPNGHSVFTWTLLQALDGKGDLNKDNYITGSELAAYAAPVVSSISLQTPAFGNLVGSEGGDFVFELSQQPEFLSELSEQLDEQELQLVAQIDELKDKIQDKRDRNLTLKKELQAVKDMLAASNQETTTSKPSAIKVNEAGLQLYREKKLEAALQKFLQAANLDPTYSEAVNNVGFLYFKLGQYENAVYWLKKTVLLEDKRSVAWLNLGDAYLNLKSYAQAEAAFKKFLQLKPQSRNTTKVQEKLALIKQQKSE